MGKGGQEHSLPGPVPSGMASAVRFQRHTLWGAVWAVVGPRSSVRLSNSPSLSRAEESSKLLRRETISDSMAGWAVTQAANAAWPSFNAAEAKPMT